MTKGSGVAQFKELASVEAGNGVWKIQQFQTEDGKVHYGLRKFVNTAKRGLVPTSNGFTAQSLEDLEAILELTKRLKAGMQKRGIV